MKVKSWDFFQSRIPKRLVTGYLRLTSTTDEIESLMGAIYSTTNLVAQRLFKNINADFVYINRSLADEFLLGEDYAPPTGLKRILRLRVGDWPLYSILLAFVSSTKTTSWWRRSTNYDSQGQVIAANSYQITLLTGQVGQPASKLYVVASIYLVTSIMWWLLYRRLMTVYVLSLPFLFYGLAFFFIGVAPYGPNIVGRGWLQNVATAWYAIASSSGSIFFAVNFGDEGKHDSR